MKTIALKLQHAAVALLRGVLRAYQLLLSPLLGPRCRFYPSCSEYSRQALATHGLLHGTTLSIKRICRCHPGQAGGIDEVPAIPAIKVPGGSVPAAHPHTCDSQHHLQQQ